MDAATTTALLIRLWYGRDSSVAAEAELVLGTLRRWSSAIRDVFVGTADAVPKELSKNAAAARNRFTIAAAPGTALLSGDLPPADAREDRPDV